MLRAANSPWRNQVVAVARLLRAHRLALVPGPDLGLGQFRGLFLALIPVQDRRRLLLPRAVHLIGKGLVFSD